MQTVLSVKCLIGDQLLVLSCNCNCDDIFCDMIENGSVFLALPSVIVAESS